LLYPGFTVNVLLDLICIEAFVDISSYCEV